MNGAQSLIKTLVNSGVEVCFTNPGTSEMHFVAALDEVDGMRCVLGLFEGVVSGAADGYARMAGKPAATLLHLGPGLGNAVANIHNAGKGYVPMINIVGEHATYHLDYDTPLKGDIEGLAGAVSDWVYTSTSSDEIAADAARAVQAAGHHNIATLVLPANVSWGDNTVGVAQTPAIPPRPQVAADQVAAAATLLREEKPAMVLIGGDIDHALSIALSKLSQATGARVCVETFPTRMRRGAGSGQLEKMPYLAEQAIEFMSEVENLVLIGAKPPVSFFAYPGVPSEIQAEACEVLSLAMPGDDLEDCVKRLLDALDAGDTEPLCYPLVTPELPTGDLNAMSVAQSLANQLPQDAIVVDEGATSSVVLFPLTAQSAAHDWLTLSGGAIGFGLPCAVGAAVACPGRKVICLEGDGSAMYTIQSLWTMAREALDITIVIFNNQKYNILELEFARTGASGGKPGPKAATMLDISGPGMDFVHIANGMGVNATRADTAEAFNEQLAAALAAPGPHLIDAHVPAFSL